MRPDDPAVVHEEYSSEARLAVRKAAHALAGGPDAREALFEAVAEVAPRRILEVGCGEGELAERLARELDAEVVAIDQSIRMVQLARERGVDARLGDAQALEFGGAAFDCVVAAWMLYHVHDLDRALAEIARVLAPDGRLVAVTNGCDHMQELYELVGCERLPSSFTAENGEEILRQHFGRVERRSALGWIVFPDTDSAQAYIDSLVLLEGTRVPSAGGPIQARRTPAIFIAER